MFAALLFTRACLLRAYLALHCDKNCLSPTGPNERHPSTQVYCYGAHISQHTLFDLCQSSKLLTHSCAYNTSPQMTLAGDQPCFATLHPFRNCIFCNCMQLHPCNWLIALLAFSFFQPNSNILTRGRSLVWSLALVK